MYVSSGRPFCIFFVDLYHGTVGNCFNKLKQTKFLQGGLISSMYWFTYWLVGINCCFVANKTCSPKKNSSHREGKTDCTLLKAAFVESQREYIIIYILSVEYIYSLCREFLYLNIQGRGVYKLTAISVYTGCPSLSFKFAACLFHIRRAQSYYETIPMGITLVIIMWITFLKTRRRRLFLSVFNSARDRLNLGTDRIFDFFLYPASDPAYRISKAGNPIYSRKFLKISAQFHIRSISKGSRKKVPTLMARPLRPYPPPLSSLFMTLSVLC